MARGVIGTISSKRERSWHETTGANTQGDTRVLLAIRFLISRSNYESDGVSIGVRKRGRKVLTAIIRLSCYKN